MSTTPSFERIRSLLIGLSLLAALVSGLIWLGAISSVATASAHGEGSLRAPRLISLTYGRYRPPGAPHAYLALRLTALEPHGQVVDAQFETPGAPTAVGDGACGLGGRRNGKISSFYMPLKLRAGLHEVTVIATGSACTTSSTKTRTTTRTFRITVR